MLDDFEDDHAGSRQKQDTMHSDLVRFALSVLRLRGVAAFVAALLVLIAPVICAQQPATLHGRVLDPQGHALAGATLHLTLASTGQTETLTTHADGSFRSTLPAIGSFIVVVEARNYQPLREQIRPSGASLEIRLSSVISRKETVNVTASIDETTLMSPDPAQRTFVHEELLDANPGRPGAPVSLPGLPIETASGGIKAPQYFVPGVAGDHGEPIAQYIAVGDFLAPNNLSANAHGNGYADPNIFVPAVLEGVQTDGGAFNVLEGNHSLNLAAAYELRPQLNRFLTLTGDDRDLDLMAGLSPADPQNHAWLALEGAYGNGLLRRLEHRQQYKANGWKVWAPGRHTLTLFGIAYYGTSYIPGLIPIVDASRLDDTIDRRQRDQTHTGEIAANDEWQLTAARQLSLSGMFRTYNLALYSNFGDGLIRQSEFRTVTATNATYLDQASGAFSWLAGLDVDRDAPRHLELAHYLSLSPFVYGPFVRVTENNVTINDAAPFAAIDGGLFHHLRYYAGWRRDEVTVSNADLEVPANSFDRLTGVNNPKGTLSWLPSAHSVLPLASFSMGEAFFTNDPRIGTGLRAGSPVERAHAAQLVLEKMVAQTDLRLTLGRTTTDQTLAKLDPDTGLQQDEGPGRLYYLTVLAAHHFNFGFLQASLSKADARDVASGEPTPEAPRTIIDVLGATNRLPWGLQARSEFEYVGHKPLGDGFEAVAVSELRGAVVKRLAEQNLEIGINFLVGRGYTGQTTEYLPPGWTLQSGPPGCPLGNLNCATVETAVGVRLPSFVAGSLSYSFPARSRN